MRSFVAVFVAVGCIGLAAGMTAHIQAWLLALAESYPGPLAPCVYSHQPHSCTLASLQALYDSARGSPLNATLEGPAWRSVLEPLLNPKVRAAARSRM